jgi:hypothetical protein
MTAALTPNPKAQFFAADGTPLVGGKLYSYVAGTTTPLATYINYAGVTANTNPVILDSRGEANVWLDNVLYKLALYDANDALIWTVDNVSAINTGIFTGPVAGTTGTFSGALTALSGAFTGNVQMASLNGGQLAGLRNRIINGNFSVNQRTYVSGAAVGTGLYGHDRWKMAASGDTYTYATALNVTTVTIPASKVLQQVIEGANLESGTYCLSWSGTAQGKIGGGSYGASGVTGSIIGGTNTTIEFGPGTVSKVQLELGTVATPFEQRPPGLELALCQRYFYRIGGTQTVEDFAVGAFVSAISYRGVVRHPMRMRGTPSTSRAGSISDLLALNSASYTATGYTLEVASIDGFTFSLVVAGATANQSGYARLNAVTAYLDVSAEL